MPIFSSDENKLIKILADGNLHSEKLLAQNIQCSLSELKDKIAKLKNIGLCFSQEQTNLQLTSPLALLNHNYIQDNIDLGTIHYFYQIDSTNEFLLNQSKKLAHGDICIAEYQSAGRGRRGKQWVSPFGQNLYFSILLKTDISELNPKSITSLSPYIAITVANALTKLGAQNIQLKWPNDIYLNNRKLGGILIETAISQNNELILVIGLGLNIMLQAQQATTIDQAWDNLCSELPNLDKTSLVIELSKQLLIAFDAFKAHGLTNKIPDWEAYDLFYNKPVKLKNEKIEFHGIAKGINSNGELILELPNNTLTTFIVGDFSLTAN